MASLLDKVTVKRKTFLFSSALHTGTVPVSNLYKKKQLKKYFIQVPVPFFNLCDEDGEKGRFKIFLQQIPGIVRGISCGQNCVQVSNVFGSGFAI
jgi:hypothetical protein